jgi:hypothetical protein
VFSKWLDQMQKAGVNPAFCMGRLRCMLLRAAWGAVGASD